jgi:hypothetical protein
MLYLDAMVQQIILKCILWNIYSGLAAKGFSGRSDILWSIQNNRITK